MMRTPGCLWLIPMLVCTAPAPGQGESVIDTTHNLSVSGPGSIRAASEQQVCVFCHTPHRSSPLQPLWNRSMPVTPYTVYTSSSLNAEPDQPTGASKMCLSCHDGTIALGSVLSRGQIIQMAGGITTLPPGTAAPALPRRRPLASSQASCDSSSESPSVWALS